MSLVSLLLSTLLCDTHHCVHVSQGDIFGFMKLCSLIITELKNLSTASRNAQMQILANVQGGYPMQPTPTPQYRPPQQPGAPYGQAPMGGPGGNSYMQPINRPGSIPYPIPPGNVPYNMQNPPQPPGANGGMYGMPGRY